MFALKRRHSLNMLHELNLPVASEYIWLAKYFCVGHAFYHYFNLLALETCLPSFSYSAPSIPCKTVEGHRFSEQLQQEIPMVYALALLILPSTFSQTPFSRSHHTSTASPAPGCLSVGNLSARKSGDMELQLDWDSVGAKQRRTYQQSGPCAPHLRASHPNASTLLRRPLLWWLPGFSHLPDSISTQAHLLSFCYFLLFLVTILFGNAIIGVL